MPVNTNTNADQTNALNIDTTLPAQTAADTTQFLDADSKASNKQSAIIDSAGETFDPVIHFGRKINDEWVPVRKKSGEFRKRRTKLSGDALQNGEAADVVKQIENLDVEGQANFLTSIYVTGHTFVYGIEAHDEKLIKPLRDAVKDFIVEEGMPVIKARYRVLVAATLYSVGVALKEKCREKTFSMLDKVKKFFKRSEQENTIKQQSNSEAV